MALTDNKNQKALKRTKVKPIGAKENFRYADKQKLEAVNTFLALGNLAMSARLLGIPEVTLRVWKASEWWKNAVDEIKMQEKIELSARMKKLVEASQTIVAQRLEQGDPVLTQKGQIVYKPVSMKDAHKVSTDLIDRRALVEKSLDFEPESEERDDNKLEKLAERFAEMATKSIEKNINKRRTVDAEDITDAVHDQRETGLQERVPEVSFSPGTNQEPDGTDDSEAAS